MRKVLTALSVLVLAVAFTGCAYWPGGTDLHYVAENAGMTNVTTGDGTFENYHATGHYTGTEFGIAIGLPFLIKFMEVYPMQSNEDLLLEIANEAADDGADAMINVTPHEGSYTGFPFGIIGLYIDRTEGTGIDVK
ncbi:hypothetical protein KQI84_12020 [bacterium]|nr:hypothetical protein [bacterium]